MSLERFSEKNDKERAMERILQLEDDFLKLSEKNMSDSEFYIARSSIDSELSKIYGQFPDLEEWNETQ